MANLLLLVALLVLPVVAGDYWVYQFGLYVLYAAAAAGLGICWGQAGFLPLGQAMFFGMAAYLSGIALKAYPDTYLVYGLLLLSALASGVLAWLIGTLVFRRQGESGPYFSLITLALSLLAFQIATSWRSVTGGFNGLAGIPGLPGLEGFSEIYYAAVAVLFAVLVLATWFLRAPLGVIWRALAQNERRVALFGFNSNRFKALAFGVSGFFAGLGGVVYAPQQGLVSPQIVGFILSAELLVWTAVGGRGRLYGPVLGTLLVGSLTSELRDTFPYWEVLMACFFIFVVLAFPQGIIGLVTPLTDALARLLRGRRGREPLPAPPFPAYGAPPRIAIDGVDVRIGEVEILNGLSVTFLDKGISCIIGPNGAGKTSTFNLLTGELNASSGRVLLGDTEITGLAPHRVMRLGFGRKFQVPSIFPDLSITDNLAIALWSNRASLADLLRPSLRRWSSPVRNELAGKYPFLADATRTAAALSHGERQILELAMALVAEPRILLLDEPCAGLSPEETARVIDVIRWASVRLDNKIIVIEHDMSLVKELADRVVVLHNGALLAEGSVAEVQKDPAVKAVYVGGQK